MSGSVVGNLTLLIDGVTVGKICHTLLVHTMNVKDSSNIMNKSGAIFTVIAYALLLGVALPHQLCQVLLPEHTKAVNRRLYFVVFF